MPIKRLLACLLLILLIASAAPITAQDGERLSGTVFTFDTDRFRIHYTLDGDDATTTEFVAEVVRALDDAWRTQIDDLGFAPPVPDGTWGGGVDLLDVYIKNIIGRRSSGEDALGYAVTVELVGDHPLTDRIEGYAATTYMVIDNDYSDATGGQTPIGLMRTTVMHEFNHVLQHGYDAAEPHYWLYEATSTWIETYAAGKDQDATGYVEYAYSYPELCFGTADDPDAGSLMYGEWLFIDHLVQLYGEFVVVELWEELIDYEGFDALEIVLARRDTTVEETLAAYRLRNLMRDYRLAPLFGATVWREGGIESLGRLGYSGLGVQELGANYFEIDLAMRGAFEFGVIDSSGDLRLWLVGMAADGVSVYEIDRRGAVDLTPYQYSYLVVFNAGYDNDIDTCDYVTYDIEIAPAKSEPLTATTRLDRAYYARLN